MILQDWTRLVSFTANANSAPLFFFWECWRNCEALPFRPFQIRTTVSGLIHLCALFRSLMCVFLFCYLKVWNQDLPREYSCCHPPPVLTTAWKSGMNVAILTAARLIAILLQSYRISVWGTRQSKKVHNSYRIRAIEKPIYPKYIKRVLTQIKLKGEPTVWIASIMSILSWL